MKVILKDLGIQSENDLSFITSEHAVQYVRELETSALKSSGDHKNLKIRVNKMRMQLNPKSQELADLLLNFLRLNPFYRMTSFEALSRCKIFDTVRDQKKEKYLR